MGFWLNEIVYPLRIRTANTMTDAEFARFCAANEPTRFERDANGEIVVMTPAGSKTSKMNIRLARLLDEWAEADGRGVASESNGGFRLPDSSVRAADAAWVERSRWDALTDDEQLGYAPVCPDFVIELRSPSDTLSELRKKMEEWLANEAELGWLIDPQRRFVEVYRPSEEPNILENPSSVQGTGCVAGFELVMDRVWGQ